MHFRDTRTTLIGNLYRPPDGDVTTALDCVKNVLLEIQGMGQKDILLLGDMNTHWERLQSNQGLSQPPEVICFKPSH